jgi:hypothetical protein
MKKILPVLILLIIMAFTASAQWVQPLDCDKLDTNIIQPKTEFMSPADICFYGTGFTDGDVTVHLGSNTVESPITNGILTSLNGFRFVDLPAGEYTLKVETSQGTYEYPEKIKVEDDHAEVPEFSTLAMILTVTIAGLFIALRRRS